MKRYRLLIINLVVLLGLLGSRWGRQIEEATISNSNFLQEVDLPFRNWRATDSPPPAIVVSTLEPDAVLIRTYLAPEGDSAELSIVAGHRKKTFHIPSSCLAGNGWEPVWRQDADLVLPDRDIATTRALLAKDGQQVLTIYFFTDGEYAARDVTAFLAVQTLKRFRGGIPVGALVRIAVPVRTTPEASGRIADAFARALVPRILPALRAVHLHLS
jgi:EpsI family protein